jgi:hypothetical protein
MLALVDWLVQLMAHRATVAQGRALPCDLPVLVPACAAVLRHFTSNFLSLLLQ